MPSPPTSLKSARCCLPHLSRPTPGGSPRWTVGGCRIGGSRVRRFLPECRVYLRERSPTRTARMPEPAYVVRTNTGALIPPYAARGRRPASRRVGQDEVARASGAHAHTAPTSEVLVVRHAVASPLARNAGARGGAHMLKRNWVGGGVRQRTPPHRT